uniref:Uncharacterized protein n=1 Tax=Trichogramma kaykai TaxID=54128 RepID=A0ABD2WIG0_9HYME
MPHAKLNHHAVVTFSLNVEMLLLSSTDDTLSMFYNYNIKFNAFNSSRRTWLLTISVNVRTRGESVHRAHARQPVQNMQILDSSIINTP